MIKQFIVLLTTLSGAPVLAAETVTENTLPNTPAVPVQPANPAKASAVPSDYAVGPGDVLEISVWKEEGLTKDALVRPDGGLTFPLVGEVQAGGKTVDQINQEIVKGLSGYLSEPAVSVAVKLVNQKFFVVGKVNKPGEFLSPERVSVMQALSMAGGLNPFADDDDIRIIRREGDQTISFTFDYGAVAKGEDMDQNIQLRRGDVVVVP